MTETPPNTDAEPSMALGLDTDLLLEIADDRSQLVEVGHLEYPRFLASDIHQLFSRHGVHTDTEHRHVGGNVGHGVGQVTDVRETVSEENADFGVAGSSAKWVVIE